MRRLKSQVPWLGLLGLFLATLVTWFLAAGDAIADNAVPFGQGRLFEVSKPGAPPSYVFGTMHITDKAVLKLPPPIAHAFKGSQVLLVESGDSFESNIDVVNAQFLAPDKKLSDVIKPALYASVMTSAKKYGISPQLVDRMQPWAVAFVIGRAIIDPGQRGMAHQPFLDEALKNYARKRGIAVVGLDRGNETTTLFKTELTLSDQILMLEDALHEAAPETSTFSKIRAAYLAGDLAAVDEIDTQTNAGAATAKKQNADVRAYEQLIVKRNERWIPRMQAYLDAGGAFVAVGCMHLPGEDGVLRLLQKAGYRVTRVL